MSLANKFHFKTDQVFDEIEQTLHKLQAESAAIRNELRALKEQKRHAAPYPIGHRWAFDAADPVYFTDALSQAEEVGPGAFKRWVLGDQSLEIALRLRRDLSYIVTIQIADLPEDAKFSATVDGHPVPMQHNDRTLRFLAPPNLDAFEAGGGLSLTVNSDGVVHDGSGTDTRVLRFSLRAIKVTPVELWTEHPSGQV